MRTSEQITLKKEQPRKKIAYVGIDYHINVLSIAVIVKGQKEFYETIRLKNDNKIIARYMQKLSKKFQIKACY